MNKRCAAVLVTLLCLPVLLHARAEGHFDRTLQVSGAVSLYVTTGSGDITVKTGGGNQVVVHGTVHANNWLFGSSENAIHQVESNPPIQQSGNSIRLGSDMPDDVRRRVSISYDITVPADTKLEAHTGSGNIQAAGVRSAVQADTGSGDIRMQDVGSGVRARTGSGNIHVEGASAPFNAQTGSGDIVADLTGSGDVEAQTGSGNVRVRGVRGGLRARTGSGDLETAGTITGPWQVHTGSGNVRVAVGTGSGFNLDAHTSSGSIHSELPIMVQGSVGNRELRGKVGAGGPAVEISTSSGDIDLR